MSFLDRPAPAATFKPPSQLKRSVPPRPVVGNPHDNRGHHRNPALQPIVPLGAAPVGLSPGLGPSNPTLLTMPNPVADTPMSIPILKDRPTVSEESIRSRMYSKEEFMSIRGETCHTPSAIMEWVLGMYRTESGVGSLRCPPHLRLLVDELEADRHGALLGGVGRKNARPVRATHNKVMSILSRLTPQKYDALKEELFQLPLKQLSDSELRDVVKVFFNKSVQEHKFSDLYARMVADICVTTEAENALEPAVRERLLQTRMRSELLTACQEEFTRPLQLTEKDRVDPITGAPLPDEEIERKRDVLKTRLVGNIKFVGELYKFNLVNPRVVNSIFRVLIFDYDPKYPTTKEDYLFEVFGMLLKTVGSRLKHDDPNVVDGVMDMVERVRGSHPTNRVKFAMMDLCDLNAKGWPVKKEVLTTEEHANAQAERIAREQAAMDRQKAQLRSVGSSSSVSSPVTQMDGNKFTPVSKRPLGPSSASTPSGTSRPFPAAGSTSTSPLTAGAPSYMAAAAGRKGMNTPANSTPAGPSAAGTPGATGRAANTNANSNGPSTPAAANTRSNANTPAATASSSNNNNAANSANNSMSSPPVVNPTRDQLKSIAVTMLKEYNEEANRPRVLQQLADYERQIVIPILTIWIREAVIVTSNFDARNSLPSLFYSIVQRCEDTSGMILSSSDLLSTVLEWIRYDIKQRRFGDCPRFFANWGAVVSRAFTLAASQAESRNRAQWTRVLSILSCATFTLSLRELVTNEFRDTVATAIRDLNNVAQQVAQHCDKMAGREPQRILNFATLARFRLLPYVIKADESDKVRIPHTPSLGPAPTAQPIGMGSGDPYHACFQIQQDDAELGLFKRVIRRDPSASTTIAAVLDSIPPSQNVTRVLTVMKVTAAMLSLLNPPTGEKALITEQEGASILRDAIRRCPSDLHAVVQAAVVMEMICFYCCNTNKLLGLGCGSPAIGALPPTPGKAGRDEAAVALGCTTETFRRWCEAGVVERATVLSALQSVAPANVPSTPGTPARMSSANLEAMDNSFSLPEAASQQGMGPRGVSTPLMSASTSSAPGTPQHLASRGSFRFDTCEMLVRNVNFISTLKWSEVVKQLQRTQPGM